MTALQAGAIGWWLVAALSALGTGLLLAGRLRVGRDARPAWRRVVVALALNALGALALSRAAEAPFALLAGLDVARAAAWMLVLALGAARAPRVELLLLGALPLLAAATASVSMRAPLAVLLALSIATLVAAEQRWSRSPRDARRHVAPVCAAVGAGALLDLVVFSHVMLFGRFELADWLARAAGALACMPLLLFGATRLPDGALRITLSHAAALRSVGLLACGAWLLAAAGIGWWVQWAGGDWSLALQWGVALAALGTLAAVGTSRRLRARCRVAVERHFFAYRWDHRVEGLRVLDTLDAGAAGGDALRQRALAALADTLGTRSAVLWLHDGDSRFVPRASLGPAPPARALDEQSPLARLMRERDWIIDTRERHQHPERYAGIPLPDWSLSPAVRFVVPLRAGSDLFGFAVLGEPDRPVTLDWEVRDLLRAVAREIASRLACERALGELLEARQFAAFNRMSAFVVHDLKNLVAQLSLMMDNASRHRDDPEFQADALHTVDHVLGRMRTLLLQLRAGAVPAESPEIVSLADVVRLALESVSCRTTGPQVTLSTADARVVAHPQRLARVIGHLVQNAVDAAGAAGTVRLAGRRERGEVVVEVADTGPGMSAEFVHERLFRAFETTKPAGLGIGMYESREYVRELGGRIEVDTLPGAGTTLRIRLPACAGAEAPATSPRPPVTA